MKLTAKGRQNYLAVVVAAIVLAALPCRGLLTSRAAADSSAVHAEDPFVRFENGEEQSFRNKEEARRFLEEYLLQYRMRDICTNRYPVVRYSDRVVLRFPDDRRYDRDALIETIWERFGSLEGASVPERIADMCYKLNEKMIYDTDFAGAPMDQSLEAGRGVCWHYVKIAAVLLQESEVPTAVVHGLLEGDSHVWLRCRLEDGTVVDVDPEEGILNDAQMKHLTVTPYITPYR